MNREPFHADERGGKVNILELHALRKTFGGLVAVDNLDLVVHQAEILGLIGPNGAGKTTVFNLISGLYPSTQGRVFFEGQDITLLKPHRRVQRGLVRTFQLTNLYKEMTVIQNVLLGGYENGHRVSFWGALMNTGPTRAKEWELRARAEEILAFLGVADFRDQLAKNLPYGLQKCLGISIALATQPKFLMLDEPMTGMNSEEIKMMMNNIRRLREHGMTILLVEHNMRSVMEVCDRICVLNFGRKIAEGTPLEIRKNPEVIRAYLGTEYVA
jgi:branched-chain amino acid transport system ATP-binding protein